MNDLQPVTRKEIIDALAMSDQEVFEKIRPKPDFDGLTDDEIRAWVKVTRRLLSLRLVPKNKIIQ